MTSRIFILFVVVAATFSRSSAQSLLPEAPVSSSLANAVIASRQPIPFALNPSQSFADSLHSFKASFSYTPFVGGLKDANLASVEATYYSGFIRSSFTLGAANLAFNDLYSDLSVYAALSKTFEIANNRMASAGIRMRYESLSTTPTYPVMHFAFIDLGFVLELTHEFSLGATALNLLGVNYKVVDGTTEKLDRRFLFGIDYHPSAVPIKILTSVEESPGEALTIGFGAEYDPVTFLALRLGTSTDTGNITTGIGIRYGEISFDAGSRFDKALGSIFSFGASGAW
jgi:hypothetical protein